MGQVTVRVNGYQHTIGCKDGEEAHVTELVEQIEQKVQVIRAMGGQFSESRMLLHVALLLADELADLKSGAPAPAASPASTSAAPTDPALAERLARVAETLDGLAQRIERG